MKRTICTLFALSIMIGIIAQEESKWKPVAHLTGYVNTVAEYIDLQNWVDADNNIGIGIAQGGFLVSYKPLKKLEFKGTFVYSHSMTDFKSLFVEAYGTYAVNDALKISGGKYLTPLSPVNQYFYAPLNPSATLPMVVSHHLLLPQSISGFQISGEIGSTSKFGYNITYGHYVPGDPAGGILGIEGRENIAPLGLIEAPPTQSSLFLGGTGRIYGNYNDIVKIGLNYFDGRNAKFPVMEMLPPDPNAPAGTPPQQNSIILDAYKYSFGTDFHLNIGGLSLNAEYWIGDLKSKGLAENISSKYLSYYAEVVYEYKIFSPYVRYDYSDDINLTLYTSFPDQVAFDAEFNTTAFSVGLAIRPIYEVLLKLEYRNISLDFKDNPLNIQYDNYNHITFSMVYSF